MMSVLKNMFRYNNAYLLKGFFAGLLLMLALMDAVLAQTPVPIGPQINTYNDTRVRGYHFTATSNWGLCGLYIPTDNSTGPQNVEFVRFTQGAPPPFAGTTNNFVSLFYAAGVAGTAMIPTPNIQVNNTNIYGTYGARSNPGNLTQMMNSYGATATVTNVNGINMTLLRSGMQFPLNNQQMHDIWSEVTYNIGRIIMYYDCCPDPPPPVFLQAPQQICANDTFEYIIDTTVWGAWDIQGIQWDPGVNGNIVGANQDSSIVQIVFNPGSFQDTICAALRDTCRVGPEACIAVIVNPLFADAGNDTSICVNTMQMNANAGLGVWSVVQGSGSFSNLNDPFATVSGMTPGMVNTFTWTLTNANCPTVSDEINVTVNPIPVALFSAPDGCHNTPISFNSTSYALGGSIIDWDWDVDGDGTIDYTTSQFQHAYNTVGTMACTLVVTANLGCQDTLIQNIEVYPNPVADFAYTPDCEGSPMAFADASNIASGGLADWFWDFGDGGQAAAQNPAHLYAEDSVYWVSLTVTSQQGCVDVHFDSVEVFTIPTVEFTAPDKCWNEEVSFTDQSTSSQGVINSWEWDFGDGSNNVLAQDTTHLYGALAGTYNVRLTVGTDKGCFNTLIKPIRIFPVPIPAFTTDGVCQDARIEFNDASILDTIFGSYLDGWHYDFGDGSQENAVSPGHFFDISKIYQVTYTPRTNHGCEQPVTQDVLIRPRPSANLVILDDKVCAGNTIHFREEAYLDNTHDSIGIVKWTWDFDNGSKSADQHPEHVFNQGGTYRIGLEVETSYGCKDSTYKDALIFHNPTAAFVVDSMEGCSPYCIVFRDESTVGSEGDLIYDWRFGNGFQSNAVNPTFCYELEDGTGSATYRPGLTVSTKQGCVDSTLADFYVSIHANPIADFTLSDHSLDMLEPVVYIDNMSEGGYFWDWSFGDGETSTTRDPFEHKYTSAGRYTITLRTASDYGCRDEVSKTLNVESHQTVFVPGSFSPNGDGLNDWLEIKGEDLIDVEIWVYDRWGNLMFHGTGPDARWDGKVGGKMSPLGTYGYVLKYQHTGQIRQTQNGTFIISKTNAKKQ